MRSIVLEPLYQSPAAYRLVTNNFVFNAGDEYVTFKPGVNPPIYSVEVLSDALVT